MKYYIISFGRNIFACFNKKNIVYHALMVVLTYLFVFSSFDWNYFLATRTLSLHAFFYPALMLGTALPIVLPPFFILLGTVSKEAYIRVLGWALLQAVLLGSLLSSSYKALTGRVHPPRGGLELIDNSHSFRFGFMEGGIFWGWPSSHTTIAFSLAFTFITLYQKNKILRYTALAYALYVGLAVSVLGIHWFSEFIAGGILGAVIGSVVGSSFILQFHKGNSWKEKN